MPFILPVDDVFASGFESSTELVEPVVELTADVPTPSTWPDIDADWDWQATWRSLSSLHLTLLAVLLLFFFVRAVAVRLSLSREGEREKWGAVRLPFARFANATASKPVVEMEEVSLEVPAPRASRPQTTLNVDTPLPAVYISEEPASMAKLIMGRHMYRRPTLPSPRRTTPKHARSVSAPTISYSPPSSSSSPSPSSTTV
ncbi:hypothetical protein HMN09_00480400 [Mycena chlorophos]|uniref:Transmembrane protein n=1 Tax=Mycena chlorophos TaxID=658473 RepID=A0A8H6TIR9_MYCCL|nr:hypothetical protein HMN09_00480400 [Mycena chlorophos]